MPSHAALVRLIPMTTSTALTQVTAVLVQCVLVSLYSRCIDAILVSVIAD
jgi:hypothetical protein